jgi:aminoglycoside phosphotransferase (APT) family kinase protein
MRIVDAMAQLHNVEPADCGLADLGRPDGFVKRQLDGWAQRWELAKDKEEPSFYDVGDRLRAAVPEPQRVSVVHNDLEFDNCQFDPNDPDHVKSIFDWDMATLGDPLIDLGTLRGYWTDPPIRRRAAHARSVRLMNFRRAPTSRGVTQKRPA